MRHFGGCKSGFGNVSALYPGVAPPYKARMSHLSLIIIRITSPAL